MAEFKFGLKNPITVKLGDVIKLDPCNISNDIDYKGVYQSIYDSILKDSAFLGNAPTPCGCADYGRVVKNVYRLGDKEYTKLDDVPRADIHAWAKENGLKISNDGKTITCYKAVHKTDDGRFLPLYETDKNAEYKVGEYAFADKLDLNQHDVCTNGIHAGSMACAMEYAEKSFWSSIAILELKVDISDEDDYVIPYERDRSWSDDVHVYTLHTSDKFRFASCYVVREVNIKKMYVDADTGEAWDME